MGRKPEGALRRGWTTGACATAATKAAAGALLGGEFPDPVSILLPKGDRPAFALAFEGRDPGPDGGAATAGVIKDAGDDPDVTHGALVLSTVRRGAAGSGIVFRAGEGVGTVTRPGLPIPPGEPAINPVPRRLITGVLQEAAAAHGLPADFEVEIAIPGGAALAEQTWNPRLGILGGLSILGTTGIVVPYSCAAWIASIHRGIDVARATGLEHAAACTGKTSEAAVARLYGLPEGAFLDMGDFAGGLLKYLRRHPLPCLTLAGGFGKFVKLAQGFLDLHSGRSQVDFAWLAERLAELGAAPALVEQARGANTAIQVLGLAQQAGLPLAEAVAERARTTALGVLEGAPVAVELLIVDRQGGIVARTGRLPGSLPGRHDG
ncbi:cobalt-precorrin-5B (C1)-methyltransferase [Tistlia consotensis]|uniref:Cobalt-precorrin-5B C(1)-methyltransferase n=1 Tax=Tistlia consotensis USBA 355 TaxID=560819 RepID=A0A1Y6B591_9PROT|nr:cobalt-precorrin-5B (C(1))-methyltransferase [Tistlia consotensis]SME92977.1 cobalt-precorrin-5B (C1)-methyltransferase [Tistlia consotensis USBA 355]SNR28367.1 cobalt-precorrin-5B (C1)-methyltransferase [Tistlia consotensis]